MNWFAMRHPETGGVGIVPESSLSIHKGLGWLRVSEAIDEFEKDHIDKAAFSGAPDLDAPKAKTFTSSKES